MYMDSSLSIAKLQQQKINNLTKKDVSKLEDRKLREQTDQFESLLIKTLLDVSMEDSNKLFGKDAGDKIYQSMFREEISKISAGNFGISETLFNFLKNKN